jgi:hypothetical protein
LHVKWLYWTAAAVALYGQARLLLSALAGRTPGAASTPIARVREGIWIALPALALILVLLASWRMLARGVGSAPPVAKSPRTVALAADSASAAGDARIGRR